MDGVAENFMYGAEVGDLQKTFTLCFAHRAFKSNGSTQVGDVRGIVPINLNDYIDGCYQPLLAICVHAQCDTGTSAKRSGE